MNYNIIIMFVLLYYVDSNDVEENHMAFPVETSPTSEDQAKHGGSGTDSGSVVCQN